MCDGEVVRFAEIVLNSSKDNVILNSKTFNTNRSNRVRCNNLVPCRQCHNDKHLNMAIPLNFVAHRLSAVVLALFDQSLLVYSLSI